MVVIVVVVEVVVVIVVMFNRFSKLVQTATDTNSMVLIYISIYVSHSCLSPVYLSVVFEIIKIKLTNIETNLDRFSQLFPLAAKTPLAPAIQVGPRGQSQRSDKSGTFAVVPR